MFLEKMLDIRIKQIALLLELLLLHTTHCILCSSLDTSLVFFLYDNILISIKATIKLIRNVAMIIVFFVSLLITKMASQNHQLLLQLVVVVRLPYSLCSLVLVVVVFGFVVVVFPLVVGFLLYLQ